MIRISKVAPFIGGFDYYVRFGAVNDEEVRIIAGWISRAFSNNFILLEMASKILAGGSVDNLRAWEDGDHDDERYLPSEYELRGSTEDISMFLLKYNGDRKF